MPTELRVRDFCVQPEKFGRLEVVEFWREDPPDESGHFAALPHWQLTAAVTQHRLVFEMRIALVRSNLSIAEYCAIANVYGDQRDSNGMSKVFGGALPLKLADISAAYLHLGTHLPPLDPVTWAQQMTYRHRQQQSPSGLITSRTGWH